MRFRQRLLGNVEQVFEDLDFSDPAGGPVSPECDYEAEHGLTPTAQAALLMQRYLHDHQPPRQPWRRVVRAVDRAADRDPDEPLLEPGGTGRPLEGALEADRFGPSSATRVSTIGARR